MQSPLAVYSSGSGLLLETVKSLYCLKEGDFWNQKISCLCTEQGPVELMTVQAAPEICQRALSGIQEEP